MIYRIFYSLVTLFAVLFLPFYVSIFLCFLGVILFEKYYEGLVLIIFFESLYQTNETKIFGLYFFFTFVLSVLLLSRDFLKKKMNLFNNDY